MKVIAINGSPRKDGNTAILINHVFAELKNEGFECELIQLAGENIAGCIGCGGCAKAKNNHCTAFNNDSVNVCIDKMIEADGIILGSPTYVANIVPTMKAFMERTGVISKYNEGIFKRKVGVAIVAARRCGAMNVFNSINEYFLSNEMIIPGSNYWNIGFGGAIGDVEKDHEGLETMKVLGKNMAWLLKRIKA